MANTGSGIADNQARSSDSLASAGAGVAQLAATVNGNTLQAGADGASNQDASGGDTRRGGSVGQQAAAASPATPSASPGALAGSATQLLDGAFSALPTPTGAVAQLISVPGSGASMQEMVDAIRATVELAVRQGSTQARIALQPEELGGIRIHLSQTAEGLVARVVGETPAAAQALAEGHAELHRSLSSLGMPLLRMDVGANSQHDARPREDRFTTRPDGPGAERSTVADEEVEGPEAVVSPDRTQRASELEGGALVDVLA